jgi:hypothetical protein
MVVLLRVVLERGQAHLYDAPNQDDESGSVLLNEVKDPRSVRQVRCQTVTGCTTP